MTWLFMRIGRGILTLLLLITFTFFALSASGDPAIIMLGPNADPHTIAAFRLKWGLGYPLWKQFLIYIDGLLHFNLGMSYATGEPVLPLVLDRVPVTLSLVAPTFFFSIALGVPAGLFAAMHKGRVMDRLTIVIAVIGLAVPSFLIGIFLMYVFSIWLGWLAPSGYVNWTSYILPVTSMVVPETAIYARFTRSAMVEVMVHPMIETAKASGLGLRLIQRVHALPSILLPLITITALEFGNTITYTAVTENLFGWPGVGALMIESVGTRDYAVVEAVILLTGITMIIANFLADLSYGFIDPRVGDQRWRGQRSKPSRNGKEKTVP